MEPTPGAGPCIDEVLDLSKEDTAEIYAAATTRGMDYAEILFFSTQSMMVSAVAYAGSECLELLGLRVIGCRDESSKAARLLESPEATSGDVWGECVEARIPADPPYRIKRALDMLREMGAEIRGVMAYRLLSPTDEVVETWTGDG